MTNPFRDMCAELVRRWDAASCDHDLLGVADAMDSARALLDQQEPAPQPPADGEVADLVWVLLNEADADDRCDHTHWLSGEQMRRIADLLQHPQPVAVSERPWEREGWCDEQGRCWWFDSGSWILLSFSQGFSWGRISHCLPHYAMPAPQ